MTDWLATQSGVFLLVFDTYVFGVLFHCCKEDFLLLCGLVQQELNKVVRYDIAGGAFPEDMPLTPSSACVVVSGLEPYLALADFPQGSCQTALWWYLAGLERHGCPRALWCAVHSSLTPLLKLGTTITGSKEESFGRMEPLCSTGCIAGQQTGFELLFDMDSFNYLGID